MSKKTQQIAVPLISVLLGILLGAIVMAIFGYDAIWGYESLFKTAFGSLRSLGEISRAMGPLVLIGLGFAVASRAGFFNVGLPGQALAGWIMAGWFALSFPDLPRPLMLIATVVIAAVAGGLIGAIPGILRAYLGTSEVIVTIMMNYIVLFVGNAFIRSFPKSVMQSVDSSKRVGANAIYQTEWFMDLNQNIGSELYTEKHFWLVTVMLALFSLVASFISYHFVKGLRDLLHNSSSYSLAIATSMIAAIVFNYLIQMGLGEGMPFLDYYLLPGATSLQIMILFLLFLLVYLLVNRYFFTTSIILVGMSLFVVANSIKF